MATYSPSKITKDGNTYNFTDVTKIPLSGTNALAGSIVPDTDNTYDFGSLTKRFRNIYITYVINPRTDVPLYLGDANAGADITLCPKELYSGFFRLRAFDGTTRWALQGTSSGALTWGSKNVAMQEDTVPRSGGAVMSGSILGRAVSNSIFRIEGGNGYNAGGTISVVGSSYPSNPGDVILHSCDNIQDQYMTLKPNGTWTWTGTACQITSDQRLKQQIAEIDDKLLDAWEDVNLVQFKYNDAVDQKGNKARLHTGYVVQQIDNACQKRGVDVSAYGLYCHEEYPEETEEIEVEQKDGTKVKERKVIREASEHYSLRYTEIYAVECMYLRRCIARLIARIEELEKGNNNK